GQQIPQVAQEIAAAADTRQPERETVGERHRAKLPAADPPSHAFGRCRRASRRPTAREVARTRGNPAWTRAKPASRLCGSMKLATRLACAALVLGACSSPPKKHQLTQQEMIAADPLPLEKGAKWTYNVTVKRFDADADKEITKTMSWVTEV